MVLLELYTYCLFCIGFCNGGSIWKFNDLIECLSWTIDGTRQSLMILLGHFHSIIILVSRTYTVRKFGRPNQLKWLGPSFLKDFIWAASQWPSSYSFFYLWIQPIVTPYKQKWLELICVSEIKVLQISDIFHLNNRQYTCTCIII